MQKRAKLARAERSSARRIVLGMTLAFGVATAGLSSAFDVRCSIAVRATVLTALHPTGPIGTSAEFRAAVGQGKQPTGP